MGKFAVGDYVEANLESNRHYSITNYSNGWRGYVRRVDGDGIITVSDRKTGSGHMYTVSDRYFDFVVLLDEGDPVVPDKDLFGFLYSQ